MFKELPKDQKIWALFICLITLVVNIVPAYIGAKLGRDYGLILFGTVAMSFVVFGASLLTALSKNLKKDEKIFFKFVPILGLVIFIFGVYMSGQIIATPADLKNDYFSFGEAYKGQYLIVEKNNQLVCYTEKSEILNFHDKIVKIIPSAINMDAYSNQLENHFSIETDNFFVSGRVGGRFYLPPDEKKYFHCIKK